MCRKGMQGYKYSWSGFRSHIGQHELRGELEYLSPSLSLLSLPPMSVVLHDGKSENIAAHPKENMTIQVVLRKYKRPGLLKRHPRHPKSIQNSQPRSCR
jgi:hypothetical protein